MEATETKEAIPVEPSKIKRNTGRRWQDHLKEKSAWLLVIGALMQGGFLVITSKLLTMGESQLERERAMLIAWHNELVQAIRDQTRAIEKLADSGRKGRDE